MDPNATLKRMREVVGTIPGHPEDYDGELFDLFENLDDWLTRGGFLPTDWNQERNAHASQ